MAVHAVMNALGSDLNKTLPSALGTVAVSRSHPYDNYSTQMYRVKPLDDYKLLDHIVDRLWEYTEKGPSQLRVDIMDLLLRMYPNNPDMYLRQANAVYALQRVLTPVCKEKLTLLESHSA
jgi:hypothetical protein